MSVYWLFKLEKYISTRFLIVAHFHSFICAFRLVLSIAFGCRGTEFVVLNSYPVHEELAMFREAERHLGVESLHVVLLRRRFDVGNQETAHHDSLVAGASESPCLAPTALLHVSIDQMRYAAEQDNAVIHLLFGLACRCGFSGEA